MQALSPTIILCQWAFDLLGLAAAAAAAAAFIAAFCLLLFRNEGRRMGVLGGRGFLLLALLLATAGPFAMVSDLALAILQMRHSGQPWALPSPADPGLLPYSTSLVLWLLGALLAWRAWAGLRRAAAKGHPASPGIRRQAGLAALVLFAAFFCHSWPFAAIPEGMSRWQAGAAVLQATLHDCFLGLGPAGALALLALPRFLRRQDFAPGEKEKTAAARWCALWAVIGYTPHCLTQLGMVLGYMFRGELPDWLLPQAGSTLLYMTAICCFAALLGARIPPRLRRPLAAAGFCLAVLAASLPFALRLAAQS